MVTLHIGGDATVAARVVACYSRLVAQQRRRHFDPVAVVAIPAAGGSFLRGGRERPRRIVASDGRYCQATDCAPGGRPTTRSFHLETGPWPVIGTRSHGSSDAASDDDQVSDMMTNPRTVVSHPGSGRGLGRLPNIAELAGRCW